MNACIINRTSSKMVVNILACLFLVPVLATFVLYKKTFSKIKKAIKLGLNFKPKPLDEIEIELEEALKIEPELKQTEEAVDLKPM